MIFLPLFVRGEDTVDLGAIHRIRAEAFQNSKVMDHVFYLSEVHGPHITNTPAFDAAGGWAVKRLQEYGLKNAHKEKWGPYGAGWSMTRFSVHLLEPQYAPLIGLPLARSVSTNGPVQGAPVLAVLRTDADFEQFKGKLKGKIVLTEPVREVKPHTNAKFSRYTDAELSGLALSAGLGLARPRTDAAALARARIKLNQFLKDEGVLAVITPALSGDGGTVVPGGGGTLEFKEPPLPPTVALTPEHYNRIARLLEGKIPVRLEVQADSEFYASTTDTFNVIADIPGGRKKDEVVILGAHLDTRYGGTGATDDATGCAVMMEAVRILKTLDLKTDRTIRVALWAAEEQGLLGSRAYVKQHFADRDTMALTAEHAKVAAYYNHDYGTGKIRGIYLQGNDMVRPIFAAWLAPFRDLGVTTVSIRDIGGTDHVAFDEVGLPGFQFIQDPVEYETRTHHSNMDLYDRIQPGDLMQAAAVIASLAYHTAIREQLLPRKPLPKPPSR